MMTQFFLLAGVALLALATLEDDAAARRWRRSPGRRSAWRS